MANTPNIGLPEIAEDQQSKYVTHNEALWIADILLHLSVISKDLGAPPGSPSAGDRYIVGLGSGSSGGDWNGHDDEIAYWDGASWDFIDPNPGFRTWVQNEDEAYVYLGDSAGWMKEGQVIGDFLGLDDTPNTFSGNAYRLLRANGAEDAVEFVDSTYDLGSNFEEKPGASQVLLRIPFVRAIRFPDDLAGSQGVVDVAPTAQADFVIKRNGTQFATMSFAGSATTATFSTDSDAEDFAPGDVLVVLGPSSQDATLSSVGFLFKGTKL